MTDSPNEGDLKVWWIPQVPLTAFEVLVPDLASAALLLNTLAKYDKFQLDHGVKPDYCNAGGLVRFEDGEWCDWYSDDGEDFDEVCRAPELLAAEIAKEKAA